MSRKQSRERTTAKLLDYQHRINDAMRTWGEAVRTVQKREPSGRELLQEGNIEIKRLIDLNPQDKPYITAAAGELRRRIKKLIAEHDAQGEGASCHENHPK